VDEDKQILHYVVLFANASNTRLANRANMTGVVNSNNNNNNNINAKTMFMVLSSWQSHCESSPGSFDECRTAPSGRRAQTKPDDLCSESACTG